MKQMLLVEQGDQHGGIEQRAHGSGPPSSSRIALTRSFETTPPRGGSGTNPWNDFSGAAPSPEPVSACRARSEITCPIVLPWRAARSRAALSTSASIVKVVRTHQTQGTRWSHRERHGALTTGSPPWLTGHLPPARHATMPPAACPPSTYSSLEADTIPEDWPPFRASTPGTEWDNDAPRCVRTATLRHLETSSIENVPQQPTTKPLAPARHRAGGRSDTRQRSAHRNLVKYLTGPRRECQTDCQVPDMMGT